MKSSIVTTLSIFALLTLSSCSEDFICEKANGYVETKEYQLSDFSGLSMGIDGNVTITIGSQQKVVVEAQREILDNLNTSVSNETWNITLNKCFRKYSQVNIFVTVPSLEHVGLSGSGSVLSNSTIVTNDFRARLSGSGTIDLTLDVNNVDTSISGSGSINLSGSTNAHDISLSGSGNANTYGLSSSNANIRVSGSGNSFVAVTNQLDVSISGSGNVFYDGNPEIKSSISGSGQIKKRN